MSLVVLVSNDPNWHAPMEALLRQEGRTIELAQDALDALVLLRTEPLPTVVIGPSVVEPDVHTLTDAAWRRHGPGFVPHVVGDLRTLPADDPQRPLKHYPNGAHFLAIRDAITAALPASAQRHDSADDVAPEAPFHAREDHAGSRSEVAPREEPWAHSWMEEAPADRPQRIEANEWVNVPAAPERPSDALAKTRAEEIQPVDIERLLRLARQESYYRLLGLEPEAGMADIDRSARALLLLFDPQHVDAYVHASSREALLEVEAAVRDARAVLTSPAARRCYDQRLQSTALPAQARRSLLR